MSNPQPPMMPVGTQSAVFFAAVTHAANEAAYIAANVAIHGTHHYRNAALLELADRFLGELSDAFVAALGVSTTARRVLISAANQRHAIARRQLSTQRDSELVASKLTEALANPRFLVTEQRDPRIFVVIGFAPSANKCITLPLKLVRADRAATKQDEWWVQTAFPLGAGRFRSMRAQGKFRTLQEGPLPPNYMCSYPS